MNKLVILSREFSFELMLVYLAVPWRPHLLLHLRIGSKVKEDWRSAYSKMVCLVRVKLASVSSCVAISFNLAEAVEICLDDIMVTDGGAEPDPPRAPVLPRAAEGAAAAALPVFPVTDSSFETSFWSSVVD